MHAAAIPYQTLLIGHGHGGRGDVLWRQQAQRRRGGGSRAFGQWRCCAHSQPAGSPPPPPPSSPQGSFLQIAGSVGLATTISKALGLLREALLAAVFGVGPVVTAFSYSSILPGFFMAVLGGINGPLQVTTLAFVSKCDQAEGHLLARKVSIAIGLICASLSLATFFFSSVIIDATAPGLLLSTSDLITRNLAILQLKIMAPCIFLAGLIGVGFGTLSAAGAYKTLSLSPIISNVSVISGVVIYKVLSNCGNISFGGLTEGAVSLALGVTVGAYGQWIWQTKVQLELGSSFLPFKIINPFKDRDCQKVLWLLVPAILGSGMLQLASLTDMYFASYIPGAAAGIGYAYLMVMAPMGILSSSILLPMTTTFARLSEISKKEELKSMVGEGLLALLVVTAPITAVVLPLSKPLVEILLQRSAFDASASTLVASLVACYVAGSFPSLARDLLAQLFNALGEGQIPCYISMVALSMNAVLDWKLAQFGPVGLVLATVFVNAFSVLAMMTLLSFKLQGLPVKQWIISFLKLVGAAFVSGALTKVVYSWLSTALLYTRVVQLVKAFSLVMASVMGVAIFALALFAIGKMELELLSNLLWSQLNHKTLTLS